MKIFVLLTIIAIGAVGAELLEEGKDDYPSSRTEDYRDDDPNQAVNQAVPQVQVIRVPGPSLQQAKLIKPLPIDRSPNIRNIFTLITILQTRKELQKAKIQQLSQRELVSDINNLIQLQIKSQQIQYQVLKKLQNLREVQAKRLDQPPKQIPQISESELLSKILAIDDQA